MNESTELYALGYRKPMKVTDEGRCVSTLGFHEDKSSSPILQLLKTMKVLLVNAIEDGTAVVKSGQNQSPDRTTASIKIKEPSNAVKIANLPIQRAGDLGDMIRHLHVVVK